MNISVIELQKATQRFSCGHFTIFSETERENFHGHDYQVALFLTMEVDDTGLSFDYRFYSRKIRDLCAQLHQTFLIPTLSPYLTCIEDEENIHCTFNHKKFSLLKSDVYLLPVANITVEELSRWFLENLTKSQDTLKEHRIHQVTAKIFSAPGGSGSSTWNRIS